MELLIKLIFCYLIGSISGSLVIGKFRSVDIRIAGSGNAGATNAFRTQGSGFALCVLLIDMAKGFISAKYISTMVLPYFSSVRVDVGFVIILCGIAAILGHVYPIYHGFKGGKGAGAAFGAVLAINWLAFIPAISIWILTLVITGYVGLGTMLAPVSMLVYSLIPGVDSPQYFIHFCIFLIFFIIFTHRSNIDRMRKGIENRFDKFMIFRAN